MLKKQLKFAKQFIIISSVPCLICFETTMNNENEIKYMYEF